MTKLTLKQQRFVNAYLRTGNGRQAAQDAGYSGSPHTLEQIASENLRKPEVTTAIAAAFKPEEDLKERVVTEIKTLAFAPTDEPLGQSHKLKALEMLAKVMSMFKENPEVNVEVNIPKSYKDIRNMTEAELVAELDRIEREKAKLAAAEKVQEHLPEAESESLSVQEDAPFTHTLRP